MMQQGQEGGGFPPILKKIQVNEFEDLPKPIEYSIPVGEQFAHFSYREPFTVGSFDNPVIRFSLDNSSNPPQTYELEYSIAPATLVELHTLRQRFNYAIEHIKSVQQDSYRDSTIAVLQNRMLQDFYDE